MSSSANQKMISYSPNYSEKEDFMVTKACASSSYCYEKEAGMKDKAYNERLEKSYEWQRSVQVNWDQDKKNLNNNIIAKMHPCSS
eukprot:2991530-Ditylum_brightwellii.AAC.1